MVAGTLEIQMLMNLARIADDMSKAKGMVGDAMRGIKDSVDLAKKAFATLGVALSVDAIVKMIDATFKLQESYVRLAEMAGTTAAVMSSMDLPARLAGTSLDHIAMSITWLGKALGEARLGKKDTANMFEALGINIKDGRDAAEVMIDVSKALMGMKDQTIAEMVAHELLGKKFVEVRPFMKELLEQGTLNATVTNEQAAAAKQFQDELIKFSFAAEQAKVALASQLLPALNDIAKAMIEAQKEGGTLMGVLVGLRKSAQFLAGVGSEQQELDDILRQLKSRYELLKLANEEAAKGNWSAQGRQKALTMEIIALEEKRNILVDVLAINNRVESVSQTSGAKVENKGPSQAELNIIAMKKWLAAYPALIAELKGFGDQYAADIKTEGILASEAFKAAGIDNLRTQTELIEKQAQLDKFQLENVIFINEQMRKANLTKGGPEGNKAAEDNATAIAKANAQIESNEVITQARIQSLRTVTAQKQLDDYQAINDAHEQTGFKISESFKTIQEIENVAYEQRKIDLALFLNSEAGQNRDAKAEMELLETEHQANLGNIMAKAAMDRRSFAQMSGMAQAKDMIGIMASLTGPLAQKNKAWFEINKAASIASATISTFEGANKALALGPIIGPPLAALIVAAGLANVAMIAGTQFGSNAGAPNTGGGSAGPVGSPSPSAQSGPAPSQTVINFHVYNNGTLVGQDGIRQFVEEGIVPALADAISNKDVIIISQTSRQASNLATV